MDDSKENTPTNSTPDDPDVKAAAEKLSSRWMSRSEKGAADGHVHQRMSDGRVRAVAVETKRLSRRPRPSDR